MGLSIASLFMSLERIEWLSKALELERKPVVLFDSAMATSNPTHKQTEKGKPRREEKIGKERANKMTRVKWGRGKREANGK